MNPARIEVPCRPEAGRHGLVIPPTSLMSFVGRKTIGRPLHGVWTNATVDSTPVPSFDERVASVHRTPARNRRVSLFVAVTTVALRDLAFSTHLRIKSRDDLLAARAADWTSSRVERE